MLEYGTIFRFLPGTRHDSTNHPIGMIIDGIKTTGGDWRYRMISYSKKDGTLITANVYGSEIRATGYQLNEENAIKLLTRYWAQDRRS